MEVNERKSTISIMNLEDTELFHYCVLFPYEVKELDFGIKYLGFYLKPNSYKKSDLLWLIAKLEKRLKVWSFGWLSRAGRLF